jgi:predicted  nucleic acid-binding Zn-ribbon protein
VTNTVNTRQDQQALNEELSTINEETAATNEELVTLNAELTQSQASSQELVEQLEASETRFRFMLNDIPQQVWTATPDAGLCEPGGLRRLWL